MASPPSGFMNLGAVVEDSPSIKISREVYQLVTGIPKVVQFQSVISMKAEIAFKLYTNSFFQAQFMLGNTTSITTVTTIGSGTITTQYLGGASIANYALLGVADFTNGSQVVHEFPKVSPKGDWEESYKPEAPQMQMNFEALGVATSIGACMEQTVGKRHYMSGDGATCTGIIT